VLGGRSDVRAVLPPNPKEFQMSMLLSRKRAQQDKSRKKELEEAMKKAGEQRDRADDKVKSEKKRPKE
jgi:hypothetical protein